MVAIPQISLRSPTAALDIDAAATRFGFFQIADHGVGLSVINDMLQATEEFFDRPNDEKKRWASPSPEINRGYAAKGTEGLSYSLGVASVPDLFEAFNLGPDVVDPDAPWAKTPFFAPNIWPSGDHASEVFRAAVVRYFNEVGALARQLTRLFAKALDMHTDFFTTYTDHSTDTLRINHYQRHSEEGEPQAGQLGMGPHTDYGIVTVLYADQVPGLQILLDGDWLDVMPNPGCFLVNLGDLTAEWTNDRWQSTLHRVLPPATGERRRSVAFFHDGNHDALVECLPTCTSSSNPPKYPPVLAGDHLMAKLLGPRTLQPSTPTIDTSAHRR